MPRGKRKHGEYEFTIWFESGARVQWKSTRAHTDQEIAAAIRRDLLSVAERIGSPEWAAAVDPVVVVPRVR